MKLRPDEELARNLLCDYLEKRFGCKLAVDLNEMDPPDIVATISGNLRWGVEVTQAFQQVARFNQGEPRSSEATYADLNRWAARLGDRTKGSRRRDYFLYLGAGALALRQDRPRLFDQAWKRESEQAIWEHITTGRTSVLKCPGLWLKPMGSGNCWKVAISPGGSACICSATTSMLERAVLPKAQMVPDWKVDVEQKWLLVLNKYPLADDVDQASSIARALAEVKPELRHFDGILWSGMADPALVAIL